MGKKTMRILGILCCLLVQSHLVQIFAWQDKSGTTAAGDPTWYEVPSAPLKFELPPNDPDYYETLMVRIHSTTGKVKAYELGCVRIEKGKLATSQTVRRWNLSQPPEDQFFPLQVLHVTAIPCSKVDQRLAVVKVEYEDGATWQLPKEDAVADKEDHPR